MFGFAEEIAMRFVPALMRSMGASDAAIGLLGSVRDLCDAVLAYPGGRLSDRWGPTRTLRLLGVVSIVGYLSTAAAPNPALVLVAAVGTMAWPSMGIVATFDVVARGKRDAMRAFSTQAMLRRVPMVVGPLLGAALVTRYGSGTGTRAAMLLAALLAVVAVVGFVRGLGSGRRGVAPPFRPVATLKAMPRPMQVLLASDVLVRFCEGLPDVFLVVYVIEQSRQPAAIFGALIALRSAVSIASYLPGVRLALALRRETVVGIGFLAYAGFPLAIAYATDLKWLALAFVVGGLREIGEPARKSLLVEQAGDAPVGDVLGTYLLVRGVMVASASLVGGALYAVAPSLPFKVASGVGLAGVLLWGALGFRRR